MKTKYVCGFCNYESEDIDAVRFHEIACGVSHSYKLLGVNAPFNEVESALSCFWGPRIAPAQEDEAFGHPGMASLMVKCHGNIQRECKYCTHRHPHKPNEHCNTVSGCVCVEVKK